MTTRFPGIEVLPLLLLMTTYPRSDSLDGNGCFSIAAPVFATAFAPQSRSKKQDRRR
jgi:hypothetical protein